MADPPWTDSPNHQRAELSSDTFAQLSYPSCTILRLRRFLTISFAAAVKLWDVKLSFCPSHYPRRSALSLPFLAIHLWFTIGGSGLLRPAHVRIRILLIS